MPFPPSQLCPFVYVLAGGSVVVVVELVEEVVELVEEVLELLAVVVLVAGTVVVVVVAVEGVGAIVRLLLVSDMPAPTRKAFSTAFFPDAVAGTVASLGSIETTPCPSVTKGPEVVEAAGVVTLPQTSRAKPTVQRFWLFGGVVACLAAVFFGCDASYRL